MSNVTNLTVADQLTEDGAALLFRAAYNGKLLFCHSRGSWMHQADGIWRPNGTDLALHYARELARSLTDAETPTTKARLGKTTFAAGVERFSRADPAFARTGEDWDRNQWVLGVPGGMVDLRTGGLLKPSPDEMITRAAACQPAKRPDCPIWLSFLREATADDAELIRFLQQWCGYCLTGLISEHALVFIYGQGGNGKSVFINTVSAILGDYAMTANMDTFTARKHEAHPTELADFQGKRLVIASEVDADRHWAEAKLKTLTGGDTIRARFMRQDFFQFAPQFKLTVVGNHQPSLNSVDAAMRRRFNIVPFIHTPPRPDRELEVRLRAEWPAILRWMIDGCADWQAWGLTRSSSVVEATNAYFEEQDVMGQWLADRCRVETRNHHLHTATSVLFRDWKAYAIAAGEPPETEKSFKTRLENRGFRWKRTNHCRGFLGIDVRASDASGDAFDR